MVFFKSALVVRRYDQQIIVQGHATTRGADTVEYVDAQTLTPDELKALPEGERVTKHLKSFSDYPFRAADQETGTPGDWLYKDGDWYECKSSVRKQNTFLQHYRSDWVRVSSSEFDTAPPEVMA